MNHKLLTEGKTITLDRRENMLIRKFFLVQEVRSIYMNQSFDAAMRETGNMYHPSTRLVRRFFNLDKILPSDKSFISNLEFLMQADSIEDMLQHQEDIPSPILLSVRKAFSTYQAFWDTSESGLEFLLAKLQAVGLQDQKGPIYKTNVLLRFLKENERKLSCYQKDRYDMIFTGTTAFVDNYCLFPLSPTRAIVNISPYFKAFFPQKGGGFRTPYIPAMLPARQFNCHFYEPPRMDLFEPCDNRNNWNYTFHVKDLTKREVLLYNGLVLNEEPEEFVFHDYRKIRDSFGAYEYLFTWQTKKHDYSGQI